MARGYPESAALAERLRTARKKRGFSYAALGKRAHVDPAQAYRICKGDFKTLSENVVRVCNVLRVPLLGHDPRRMLDDSGEARRLISELLNTWDNPEGAEKLGRLLTVARAIRDK